MVGGGGVRLEVEYSSVLQQSECGANQWGALSTAQPLPTVLEAEAGGGGHLRRPAGEVLDHHHRLLRRDVSLHPRPPARAEQEDGGNHP